MYSFGFILSGQFQSNVVLQVDMYSFGVILWELITTEVARRGRLRAIQVRLHPKPNPTERVANCGTPVQLKIQFEDA